MVNSEIKSTDVT